MERTNFYHNVTLLLAVLLFSFLIASCANSFDRPIATDSLIKLIAVALVAIYEVVVRLIPGIGNISIIALIIKILKYLSDNLTRAKINP